MSSSNPANMIPKYGRTTMQCNRDIKSGKSGPLNSNQAVRKFYRSRLEQNHNAASVERHMDTKDAGHIIARNKGGKDTASNYMIEDRSDNRSHGDARIKRSEMKKAGRL